MLKNTDGTYKVLNKKILKRVSLFAGISCTSLFVSLMQPKEVKTTDNNVKVEANYNSDRDYYIKIYDEIYQSLDLNSFDSKFMDIYQNGIIVVDGKEYPLEDLRVRHAENGTTHFVLFEDNFFDVYTKEKFNDKIDFFCSFRDSTIFFDMYKDGIITSDKINLSKEDMEKYSTDWVPDTHVGIPRLMAERETSKIYRNRKGR